LGGTRITRIKSSDIFFVRSTVPAYCAGATPIAYKVFQVALVQMSFRTVLTCGTSENKVVLCLPSRILLRNLPELRTKLDVRTCHARQQFLPGCRILSHGNRPRCCTTALSFDTLHVMPSSECGVLQDAASLENFVLPGAALSMSPHFLHLHDIPSRNATGTAEGRDKILVGHRRRKSPPSALAASWAALRASVS
jgi:hypothetical protein